MTSIPLERRSGTKGTRGTYECLLDGRAELATGSFAHALEWIDRQKTLPYALVIEEQEGTWEPVLAKGNSTPEARERVLTTYGLVLPEDGSVGRHC